MSKTNMTCKDKWAILEFIGCGYILRENRLAKEKAKSLANGEYRNRDIILTISSEDLPGRISCLNNLAFA